MVDWDENRSEKYYRGTDTRRATGFLGAWLIPMEILVLRSSFAWCRIGWVLLGGGGFLANIVLITLAPETTAIADLFTIRATIGKFAILLSLLIRGVPARAPETR